MDTPRTLLATLMLLAAGAPLAGEYRVSVTREDRNLYRVDGEGLIIRTRYCYEYVYSEAAFLRTSYGTGKLTFLDAEATCDVEGVYAEANLDGGSYRVDLTREDDDWYRVDLGDTYVQTSMCLQLALGEDALLEISAAGQGKAYFLDSEDSCTVEAVYVEQNP